jgi:hypothetical protein
MGLLKTQIQIEKLSQIVGNILSFRSMTIGGDAVGLVNAVS